MKNESPDHCSYYNNKNATRLENAKIEVNATFTSNGEHNNWVRMRQHEINATTGKIIMFSVNNKLSIICYHM